MRGELALGDGFFSMLRTRVGYSDYTHTEFEGDEVGTVFDVAGIEARAELVQNDSGRLGGTLGVQYYYRDFEAIGDEAFVAPNRTDQFAIFALQEYDLDFFQIEGAARYEMANIESVPLGVERDFEEAAEWFNKAAEQGDATAQFYLGLMYVKGEGVDKDPVEAHKWAIIASSLSPPGRIRNNAEKARKLFERTMTIGEIAGARRLAKAWMAKHGGGK